MSLEKQLSLNQNGGVYYEGTRVTPTENPVLFVGLGGTGIDALLRVKNEVQTRMPLPKGSNGQILSTSPNNIAFLAIDTDEDKFKNSYGVASFDASGDECIKLTVDGLGQVISSVVEKKLDSEEWNWYDRDLSANGSGLNGANGIRQIGRFMLFQRVNEIRARFTTAIDKVLEATKDNNKTSLNIFVTTGIGGGTGSGTFLDIAYILRAVALQRTPNVQVHGYIFTPDLNKGDKPSLYRNGFASLKELDYWMCGSEHGQHFIQKYNGDFKIDSAACPFDFCHLVTSQDAEHKIVSYGEAMDAVASNLFAYIVGEQVADAEGNTAAKQMYDNIAGHIAGAKKPHPANYNYLSIGSDKLEIPYTEITTLVAARVFKKLEPVFQNEPTKELFDTDMYKLELTPNHLKTFIQRDVAMNPVQGAKEKYADIWPNNLPFNKAERWLEHAKVTMHKNRINFAAVKEGLLCNYMHVILKDISRGPCYAARLLFSNTSFCMIKTLEGFRENCQGAVANLVAKAGPLKTKMEQTYMSGRNAGVFGKGNAAEEYMEALSGWLRNEYDYIMYSELVDALDDLIVRLKKYYDRIFKNLMDALCMLPGIFEGNVKLIAVKENEAQKQGASSSTYLIRPLEFEAKYRETLTKKVDHIESAFLTSLDADLVKWVGLDLGDIDSDILASSDIGGFIAQFINENFKEVLDMNMETLLIDKMSPGESDLQHIRKELDSIKNGSVPLFHISVDSATDLDLKAFSLVSVPNDCPKIFSVANRSDKPREESPKKSAERSKLQWVKVMSGMPLYAFPAICDMEAYYEDAMNTSVDTRKGVHLRYEWREQLPSPIPESTWPAAVVNNSEKAYAKEYNARIRKAFDKCVDAGIIRVEPGAANASLYMADASILDNLEFHGSIQEKKEQLELVRKNLWGPTAKVEKLEPFGSDLDKPMLDRAKENVLRFFNKSQAILRQVEIYEKFESLSAGFANVEKYINALFADLIYSHGFDLRFRRSELDYSPIKLFDKMSQAAYPEYETYKAFCGILTPEIAENIKQQFERSRGALISMDGGFIAEAVEAKAAVLLSLKDTFLKAIATLQERIERTPLEQRGSLLETYDFYQKAAEIVSDILRTIGK